MRLFCRRGYHVDQEEIYQALQKSAGGSQISLKYPKSGDRLSAFTVADLDRDGSNEAIVFYETGRTGEDENPLRLCLLDQQDGTWCAVREYPAAGAEVERVDIEQLGNNPRTNLIVSYSMVDGADYEAEIFYYENGELYSSLSVPYSALALRDLDLDGTQEIFAASSAKAQESATATVYALDREGRYIQSPLELSNTFTDITRLAYGMLPSEIGGAEVPAVYIDGMAGATSVKTVVLTYQEQQLSFIYTDSSDRFLDTERPVGCQTMDIDGDGEAEIPVDSSFYGFNSDSEQSNAKMINWYVCRSGMLMREHSSYYSIQNGYVFLMPKRWEHRVAAQREDEEIVFYELDPETLEPDGEESDNTPKLLRPLLRIAVTGDPVSADAMQQDGYTLLRQNGGSYYLCAIQQGGKSLTLTESELLAAMKFL